VTLRCGSRERCGAIARPRAEICTFTQQHPRALARPR
jgi:hypothetical protein